MNENTRTGKRSAYSTSAALNHQRRLAEIQSFNDLRLPPEVQKRRVASVMENELTQSQRDTVAAVLSGRTIREIARERGVNPSTVSRTFSRGFERLRRFLRY